MASRPRVSYQVIRLPWEPEGGSQVERIGPGLATAIIASVPDGAVAWARVGSSSGDLIPLHRFPVVRFPCPLEYLAVEWARGDAEGEAGEVSLLLLERGDGGVVVG